ncbi:hypothetical protein H0H92_014646 [Tricholoma furcatifolium]|nr:hypothetical protein H0H92_014646 [Tricholoma furcatifolium]
MSSQRRSSSFGTQKQEHLIESALSLKANLEAANIQLPRYIAEFKTFKLDESDDTQELLQDRKDPAIVAVDVEDQISFLRKLKFQFVEQNAKDRYVKSIVSDVDDALIVTAEDNKALLASNSAKKEQLKLTKASLAETQADIRTIAPLVANEYKKLVALSTTANTLSQKIVDARLALTRLRKTHPHPRLTIPLADQKLVDQVEEMQAFNDELESVNADVHNIKEQVKSGALDLERIRTERADVERAVKAVRVDEDDARIVPLYSWYTASTKLHRSMAGLLDIHAASENELRLTYAVDTPYDGPAERVTVTITLIFVPDTRQLAAVQTRGLKELGVEVGDLIDAHVQVNDVHGLVAAILCRARARTRSE